MKPTKLLQEICERTYQNGMRFQGKIPPQSTEVDGKYLLSFGGGWTDSFYVGMLYLAYAETRDKKFLEIAEQYQPFFRQRAKNDLNWCEQNHVLPLDHDTGFIFSLSQVRRYQLTGEPEARELALKAARSLAGRFHENGQFIRAWDTWPWDDDPQFIQDKKGKMIVDSMMNLSLLFWAGRESSNPDFTRIAQSHADTVADFIVRPDFSTFHQFNFDPETGRPLGGCTGQGYADDSCWSRGQAWAIYGFSQTYLNTRQKKYLDTALGCAAYFIDHLTPAGLPLWDFNCSHASFRPFDSSAAAIALSGLLNLDSCTENKKVKQGILKIYEGLVRYCSAMELPGWESILLHACTGPAYQKGRETVLVNPMVDGPIIYGDYYFMEALMKMHNQEYIEFLR